MYNHFFYCTVYFSLEEELGQVEKEYNRMPKKEELEQLVKQLTRDTEQLKDETQLVSGEITYVWLGKVNIAAEYNYQCPLIFFINVLDIYQ